MIAGLTSRAAVLKAMQEFDRLGRPAFLEAHGFGPARTYFVRHRGNLYDSKALSGVAYGIQHPTRDPLRSSDFTGGQHTSVATLRALGFEVVSNDSQKTRPLRPGDRYSWADLGRRFDFKANYLSIAGGMVPRPSHDAVLLISHPEGGKSFDYSDYWDGADLVYTGRGLEGDQRLEGANRDVAENRRKLLLFEHVSSKELAYVSQVSCVDRWEAIAPDRRGRDRRVYRFRLRPTSRVSRTAGRERVRRATERSRKRAASSFRPRAFDPERESAPYEPGGVRDPDKQRVRSEQANKGHQSTLRTFGLWLDANAWARIEEVDGATDLMAVRPGRRRRRVLFEIKTISVVSERDRVRGGLAQLLEYRFFLGSREDMLCLVTNRPIGDRRLQLLDALAIGHAYVEGARVYVSGTRASRLIFRTVAS